MHCYKVPSHGNAAFHQQENTDFNFSKLQVDETFIGKRKYNRGKRVRKIGWWFVTVTEIDDRKMGRTHWKLVKRREVATAKQRRKAWQTRFINILECICTHYGYEANDEQLDVSYSHCSFYLSEDASISSEVILGSDESE